MFGVLLFLGNIEVVTLSMRGWLRMLHFYSCGMGKRKIIPFKLCHYQHGRRQLRIQMSSDIVIQKIGLDDYHYTRTTVYLF
jgi:hypothetical protein